MKRRNKLFLALGLTLAISGGVAIGTNIYSQSKIKEVSCEIAKTELKLKEEEPTDPEVEEVKTKLQELKEKLLSLTNNQLVNNVINWAIDGGILSAFVIIWAKYRKYKSLSSNEICELVRNDVKETAAKVIKELDENQLKALISQFDKIQEKFDVLMKAFVLAQDQTAKGKSALMEYLEVKNKEENNEVTETIVEKKEEVKKEIEANEEVEKEIEKEFVPID